MKKLIFLLIALSATASLCAQEKWSASKEWSYNLPRSYKDTLKNMSAQDVYFFCRDKHLKIDSVTKVFNQIERDFSHVTAATPDKFKSHDYVSKDSTLSYLLEQVKTANNLLSILPYQSDSLDLFWNNKLSNYDIKKGITEEFLSDASLFCMNADMDIRGMEILNIASRKFCDYIVLLNQNSELDGGNSQQEGWEITHHDGDELTGDKAYDSFMYNDEDGNSFVYWSDSHDSFRIISNDGIFDYETFIFGAAKPHYYLKNIKVGYYDENGKLVDSNKTTMMIREGKPNQAGTPGLKTGKKVVKYLEQSRGYIRIVAPIYGSNVPFDIKVPCRNK